MSDLIDRQEAIDAVGNTFDRETILYGFVRTIAIRALRKMPSAQPEQRWIPVSERLPETTKRFTDAEGFDELEDGSYMPVGVFTCYESEEVLIYAICKDIDSSTATKHCFTAIYCEWQYEDGRESEFAWRDNCSGDLDFADVVAWRPLPEPYRRN